MRIYLCLKYIQPFIIHDSYSHNTEFTHFLIVVFFGTDYFLRSDAFGTFRHSHRSWQKEDRRPAVNCAPLIPIDDHSLRVRVAESPEDVRQMSESNQ